MGKFIDLTGKRFGRLIVIQRTDQYQSGHIAWLCRCDCGNVAVVSGNRLKQGVTKSCGCYKREKTAETHYTHGYRKTRLYRTYRNMLSRCYNKNVENYKRYGMRGIKVCAEWQDPKAFFEWAVANGYRDDLSIDRIDVNGDYCPENCRWVTNAIQARNRRAFRGKQLPVGVTRTPNGRYVAQIRADYKSKYLGTFDTVEEASEVYKRAKEERDKEQG